MASSKVDEKVIEEEMQGHAQVLKHLYAYLETIMLRCAVHFGIPDIIHKHDAITLSQLATELSVDSVTIDRLHRVMRFMVQMKLFTLTSEGKYGLTPASMSLLKDHEMSLVPYIILSVPLKNFSAFDFFTNLFDKNNKTTTETSLGMSYYESLNSDSTRNLRFNNGMASLSACMSRALMLGLAKEKILEGVASLLDVGGSSGAIAKSIADAFPHVKCSILDLPHVVDSVSKYPILNYIAGDMFAFVPNTDAVLMRWILHNYDDEKCIQILSKCKEAVSPNNGKIIVVDIVLDTNELPEFSHMRYGMEMIMMKLLGGRERTKEEWAILFEKSGFSRFKIVPILSYESIIIAYP